MQRILKTLTTIGLVALVSTALSTRAEAGFVPVFVGSAPDGAGMTNYNYTLNFTTNTTTSETLAAGDFITMYDIGPATIVAPGLSVTQTLLGTTAPLTTPTDNASILNVTFTYNGATLATDTTFVGIVITSPFALRLGQYTSRDTIGTGNNHQIGQVLLPSPIPEPASVALLGLGGLVGLVGLRRRKSSV